MDIQWWKLPGPARFLDQLVDDLREGRCLVLRLPQHGPKHLKAALRAAVGEGMLRWVHLPPTEEASPAEQLYRRFLPHAPASALRSPRTLAQEEDFLGQLVWIEGLSPSQWPDWQQFLLQYADFSRAQSPFARSLFCVLLEGHAALCPIQEDVCLSAHTWRGQLDRIDVLSHAHSLLRQRIPHPLKRQLTLSLLAHLAVWDTQLVEHLAQHSIEELMEPIPLLLDFASLRGWSLPKDHDDAQIWAEGMAEELHGVATLHSSLLALQGHQAPILQRLWSGQVSVLFPYIEEQRLDLLQQLRPQLHVPFTTRFGEVITTFEGLELGHIHYQLCDPHLQTSRSLQQRVDLLRQIRNHLSHLKPVPFAQLRKLLSL